MEDFWTERRQRLEVAVLIAPIAGVIIFQGAMPLLGANKFINHPTHCLPRHLVIQNGAIRAVTKTRSESAAEAKMEPGGLPSGDAGGTWKS